jgi:hypothetical protein
MEILDPNAPPTPSKEELISQLSKPIATVMSGEMADESDIDRVWLLRMAHKNSLYYRDLAYFAPALYQGLVDTTGVDGSILPDDSWQGNGVYDYTQNIYRGYCRKMEAVLGTRIPNAVAVPNDPSDEKDIAAARAANNAAMYVRQQCELQVQILWLVYKLFNFGTSFWTLEWVEDAEKYGWKEIPQNATEQLGLGGGFQCPQCGDVAPGDARPPQCPQCGGDMNSAAYQEPAQANVPADLPPTRVPKGGLEIDIADVTEVSVPLDTDGMKGTDACLWIRREREKHKAILLQKYGDTLREAIKSGDNAFENESVSLQYGESVRSSMASPIGIVRPKRENRWTIIEEDWTPAMYEMVDDKPSRKLLKENFPDGVRITAVKGHVIDLENRKLTDHWQACQPEPTQRIMCEPLGQDWVQTQDLLNNILNQCAETIERSNEPGFADPTRVDMDAWQRRRDNPGDLIPAVRPPGGTLADLIYRPQSLTFSEQIPPWRAQVEETSQDTSGLTPIIWGGDTSDPTARQSELKTNAAIRQLSVIWVMVGKSLESVYEKACNLLAEHEDGVLAFSKQRANEYGKFDTVMVAIEDLKGGHYHFEADEAIPMTWGQQRDLLMWMLDKPADILKAWGLDDPLNIYEFKELLGMPGMHVPHLDQRDKCMDVIGKLLEGAPQPGPVNPDGSAGPQVPSVQPDWEDDVDFCAKLVGQYLVNNFELAESNPNGYANLQLYGQACQKKAQQPPPKPPIKPSVSVSLKGSDLGSPAITEALQQSGIEPPGVQAQIQPPQPKPVSVPIPQPIPGAMPPPPAQ